MRRDLAAAYEAYLASVRLRITPPRGAIIARVLMQLGEFAFDDLRQDLAGVTRPTLYRTIAELVAAGLIIPLGDSHYRRA